MFEVILQNKKNPKSPHYFKTDNAEELYSFFQRHSGQKEQGRSPEKQKKGEASGKQKMRENIQKNIDRLKFLKKNWGGKGEPPIHPALINRAKDLVSNIFDIIPFKPKVTPTRNGIQLEFINNHGKELEFKIEKGGIKYLKWSAEDNEQDFLLFSEVDKIRNLIVWVS